MCERVCFADIPLCIELAKHSGGDTDHRVPGSNLAAISGQIAERQKSRDGKTARKKEGKTEDMWQGKEQLGSVEERQVTESSM